MEIKGFLGLCLHATRELIISNLVLSIFDRQDFLILREFMSKESHLVRLHQFIYQRLSKDNILSKGLSIYRQIPRNASYPYLTFGRVLLLDKSVKDLVRMYCLSDIHLYARDVNMDQVLLWSERVKQVLVATNLSWQGLYISEINFLQMEIDLSSDGKTHKATMKFKFNLEERHGGSKRLASIA